MNMKKNKISPFFTIFFLLIALSSCSFSDFVSDFNQKYHEYISSGEGYFHSDTGNSIELIDNAFNSKMDINNQNLLDDFSGNTSSSDASRLSITKNVTDLEYNIGMTPSTGKVKGLVIPVDFVDYPISNIQYADNPLPAYQSVSSYYYNSSYGALDIEFDVLDWYRLSHSSSYYKNLSNKTYAGEVPGVSAILHEVLKSIDDQIDFNEYDSNQDGFIDCLHILYSHPIDRIDADFWWAYQYYNLNEIYYDGVLPYAYVFASFNFLFEDDENCNARTYIHETGHLFGLEDYYDYDSKKGFNKGGLGGYDMMDATIGEHNPFSKISLGWIKNPVLLDLSENYNLTLTIDSFEKNGDTILVPKGSFNKEKGMFQSYYLIQLLNPQSRLLNNEYDRINKLGIRIFEVNAELATFQDGESSYVYYQNDNSYSSINLINAINKDRLDYYYYPNEYESFCASNYNLFFENDSLTFSNTTIKMTVSKIDSTNLQATLTFKRFL